jgi:ABC-2 type transport system ATP-binding protein/sodium transport system ATP-binding protein
MQLLVTHALIHYNPPIVSLIGQMERSAAMIRVENVTRCFAVAGGTQVRAVDGVSFHVAAGEVYGLLGPNGAGKTTTLRIILGLLRATSGRASIGGCSVADAPEEVKRQVGLVSSNSALYQHLSIREMLLFCADLYRVPPAAARAELERLAHLLGFIELLDRRCATLSTGQRQRVNLARALIHRPPVLLLDEPTAGLDVLGSQVVAEFIAHTRAEGKAVLLTTHQLDEAERLCDRFGLLHRGRLVSTGTLAELRAASGCATLVEMFLKLADMGPALKTASSAAVCVQEARRS